MNEYEEAYWHREPALSAETSNKWTFSLATILRAVTLVGMGLGWMLLLPIAAPATSQALVLTIGGGLALLVASRRSGRTSERVRAGCGFFANSILIAVYTRCIAFAIQTPVDTRHHWRSLDELFVVVPIAAGLPIILVSLVFMLRAWIWSANDRLLDRRRGILEE